MEKKKVKVLENIVLITIFLVLIQTLVEDLSIVLGWSWKTRSSLIIAGFCFDLFFTIEFITRIFIAINKGKLREYLVIQRGWIDLLASIPLLLLNSGPAVGAILLGGSVIGGVAGILNVLKVIKAVRIARVLRLLRVLKLFKQIKNENSIMTQRHISKIATIGVSFFVGVLLLMSVITQLFSLPTAERENNEQLVQIMIAYHEGNEAVVDICSNLLIVKEAGKTIYSRYENDYYKTNFGFADYTYSEYMDKEFFFDNRNMEKIQSMNSLLYFVIILCIVIAYTLFYSPHFAVTVSDPIHVMRRGLNEKNYNFEVKIPKDFKKDEVFELAKSYNENFLPMKDRMQVDDESDAESLELKIEDIDSLF